jgi:chromosome segregation ATPase
MNQKEAKTTKIKNNSNTSQINKQKTKNKSKPKRENRTYRPQSKISKKNSKVEQEPYIPQSLQKEINDLKLLIEKKNNEINYINKENEKNTILILEKEKEIMNNQNKIETFTNEIAELKNKNENLVKEVNNKEAQIKEMNYTLMEYKQKIISNEETDKFINKLKDSFVESNNDMSKAIENFESEINNLKSKLNESEIKNSKLTFDNNILSNKIESIYKEKDEQIKVIESLYQKQIDNCNKSISQLNDKLLQSLKENSNKISSDEESINKRIEKEKKMKLLEVENIKFKKEIEGITHEKEELKKISLDKDKIIEKLEVEIEKYDYENNNNNKDKFKKEELEKEINNLKKENEELKIMFKKNDSRNK